MMCDGGKRKGAGAAAGLLTAQACGSPPRGRGKADASSLCSLPPASCGQMMSLLFAFAAEPDQRDKSGISPRQVRGGPFMSTPPSHPLHGCHPHSSVPLPAARSSLT